MHSSPTLELRTQRDPHKYFRRGALFVALLLSGGNLIFPRPLLAILLLGLSFLATGLKGFHWKRTSIVWVLLTVILIVTITRPGPIHVESLVIRYANFIAALLLLCAYLRQNKTLLAKDLFSILPWFGVQTLITFLLANTVPFLFTTIHLNNEGSFRTILLIFNYHDLLANHAGFKRPDGFFFEPGILQIYLNIYLYLSLLVFKKKNHATLAITAIFSTLSTTGVVISAILLTIASFPKKTAIAPKKLALSLLLATTIGPIVFYGAYINVREKFTGETRGSAIARQYDLLTGINVIREYPLRGIGFNHDEYLKKAETLGYAETLLSEDNTTDRTSTNGIVYLYYSIGIPLGSLFIWGIYYQRLLPHRFSVSITLILSLLGESIVFTPFPLIFIFSAFTPFIKTPLQPEENAAYKNSKRSIRKDL